LFRIPSRGGRVIWEITNQCNYHCPYCIFSAQHRRPDQELSTARVQKIVIELGTAGYRSLKFTGGEPFLRPDMIAIMKWSKKQGMEVDISTNASLITAEMARQLAALRLSYIHVSLDGGISEIHESLRGKNTFAPTIRGIKNLVAAGVTVRLGAVIAKNNESHLVELINLAIGLGAAEIIFSLLEPVGRLRENSEYLTTHGTFYWEKRLMTWKYKYKNQIKISFSLGGSESGAKGNCPGGNKFLFINHLGLVSPCTWVSERSPEFISHKSLYQYSLKEVMNNEVQRFYAIVRDAEKCGHGGCPMRQMKAFEEICNIEKFFRKQQYRLLKNGDFKTISKIYPLTTENVEGFIDELRLKNRKVLTVAGSGDQKLFFMARGAKMADEFDVNIFAKYFGEVKQAATEGLSFTNGEKFFNVTSNDFLNKDYYKKIESSLSPMTRTFFNHLYRCKTLERLKLFKVEYQDKMVEFNRKLRLEVASQSERKMNRQEFYNCSVIDLSERIIEKYDLIYLSNLTDYSHLMFPGEDYLDEFREKTVLPLLKKLNRHGQLVLAYVYDDGNLQRKCYRNNINDHVKRRKVFAAIPSIKYREIIFPGVMGGNSRDAVIILEKF